MVYVDVCSALKLQQQFEVALIQLIEFLCASYALPRLFEAPDILHVYPLYLNFATPLMISKVLCRLFMWCSVTVSRQRATMHNESSINVALLRLS